MWYYGDIVLTLLLLLLAIAPSCTPSCQVGTWVVASTAFYFAIYRPEEQRRAAERKATVLTFQDDTVKVGKEKSSGRSSERGT